MKKNDDKSEKSEKSEKREKDDKKSEKQEISKDDDKALFIQRLGAYLIDLIIISFIASLIALPFVDMDQYNTLENKATEVMENYMDGKINMETYSLEYMDVSYKLARSSGMITIATVILGILYFIVFQIYNNGQTVGKKLFKIRIESDDGELTMNQMMIRSLIANSILVDIISFTFMLFGSKEVYFFGAVTFEMIQLVIVIISIFMVMYAKEGRAIHDRIAHTRVIKLK